MSRAGGTLPPSVAQGVAQHLGGPIREVARVGGGSIHHTARVRTEEGSTAFLKWSEREAPVGFPQEARGLAALEARGGVPVPRVLGFEEAAGAGPGWLLLQWVEPGPPSSDTHLAFGRGLAQLHRPLPNPEAGWDEDGWIATLPQANPPEADWPRFWARARLEPQWRRARREGRIGAGDDDAMERLLGGLDRALDGWRADGVALLHGDLWSGNVLVAHDGRAHLVDPAAYRGHREVDLAMMELFGGFERAVVEAYDEVRPLVPGYREFRRDVYQLYPLLVHVNLFGEGYVGRTLATLNRVLARLG